MFIHDSCFSWQYRSDTFLEHVSFSRLFLKQHWSRVKISTVGSSYSLRVRAQIKFVRNLFLLCVQQDVCDLSTPSTMFPQEEVSR